VEVIGPRVTAAQQATFELHRPIRGMVFPGTTAEVQECLRIAAHHKIPVYAISRGKNWGLGSCLPSADGCVLMNLGRMNRLISYNEELSYLTVEAGVTFAQAAEFLREKNSPHYLCVIGGPPDGSLIGNALERGDGAGKYGDRLLHACSFEVVLPTGEIIHTGLGRFDKVSAAPVHRYGVGPAMEGLFTQSNFGVVTQATFWLPRKPSEFQSVLFTIETGSQMLEVAERARELMALGVLLPNSLAIWNAYKFATTNHQYPWEMTAGRKPLKPEEVTALKGPGAGAKWIGVAGLYSASKAHARADRKLLRGKLRPLTKKLLFVDRTTARLAMFFRRPLKKLGLDVDSVIRVLFGEPIFLGYPTKKSIGGCYWRKRSAIPADPDPDRDRCGVLWLCPAVPFTKDHIQKSVEICSRISFENGFEPHIAITFPSERCVYVLPSLLYDRDDVVDDAAAFRCHDLMFKALLEAGYFPHRLGIQSMGMLPAPQDDYPAVWRRLKSAFDPSAILAPGRYEP
jgi:4-cresol dehydrogenase (hydroxylating)